MSVNHGLGSVQFSKNHLSVSVLKLAQHRNVPTVKHYYLHATNFHKF